MCLFMFFLLYRPFGGPPVPFYTYIQWMLDHGILFSTMFGIGQLLVKERGITTTCLSLDTAFKHLHCPENTIYVFPEMKLRGPSSNSCIQISVNDERVCIPTIGLVGIYKSLTNT
jgi:hypothetical protein